MGVIHGMNIFICNASILKIYLQLGYHLFNFPRKISSKSCGASINHYGFVFT
jgi:hypothetical protein